MTMIVFGEMPVDVELIVFDKDGTLIDFHHLWNQRAQWGIDALVDRVRGTDQLRADLYAALGFDPITRRALSNGPFTTAPVDALSVIAASVVYRHAIIWDEAVLHVTQTFSAALRTPPDDDLVRPRGDLTRLFADINGLGVKLAVATTDDRIPTQHTLRRLGLNDLLEKLICGNDEGPRKPDPEVLHQLAERLAVPIDKVVMVGDTVGDLRMAKHAGAKAIGITGGADVRDQLAPFADTLITSLADIQTQT